MKSTKVQTLRGHLSWKGILILIHIDIVIEALQQAKHTYNIIYIYKAMEEMIYREERILSDNNY